MTTLAEVLVNGFSSGAVYALIALGFVIIYKATEVINFAQPSMLLAGGYAIAVLHDDIGFLPALGAGIALTAVLGAAIEFLVLRRMKTAAHGTVSIVTIGVDIFLTVEIARRIGSDVLALGDPWGSRTFELGGITIAHTRVAAFAIAVVTITLFLLAFKFTSW